MIIDLALSTGLRVSEIANLQIGHLQIRGKEPMLWVVEGKARRKRGRNQRKEKEPVHLGKSVLEHVKDYLEWKETVGEGTSDNDLLFLSKRKGRYTTRALQPIFKDACKRAGLSEEYSIHSCRHSCGTYLYQKTKNLRLVQKEVRHRNIQTTTVYSDIVPEDAVAGVNGVWD